MSAKARSEVENLEVCQGKFATTPLRRNSRNDGRYPPLKSTLLRTGSCGEAKSIYNRLLPSF